jgi:hypothetical protein
VARRRPDPSMPFSRHKPRFKPQPTVLVICEDSKSSKYYLDDVNIHFRAQIKVRVAHIGRTDPKGIISEAVRQRKDFERVFCVIDRDEHPQFDQAINSVAKTSGVEVICSYPCFEHTFRTSET